jgi:N-acetylmuramoyl-L-alanine amidase
MKIIFVPKKQALITVLAIAFFLLLPALKNYQDDEQRWRQEMYRPGLEEKLVMIDPGHGGADPGAIAGGTAEKDINLAISRALQQELREGKIEARLTREEQGGINPAATMTLLERYRNLLARKALADEARAHVFVSIHTNSNKDRRASGGIVYYHPGNPYNKVLAEMIQEELNGLYKTRRTIEQADFTVVNGNAMPAVLVETGFITNSGDRRRLTDPEFQQAVARAVHRGLEKYAEKLTGNLPQE